MRACVHVCMYAVIIHSLTVLVSVQVRCSNTTNVPSCGSTCDKVLECGRHRCEELCHAGMCVLYLY